MFLTCDVAGKCEEHWCLQVCHRHDRGTPVQERWVDPFKWYPISQLSLAAPGNFIAQSIYYCSSSPHFFRSKQFPSSILSPRYSSKIKGNLGQLWNHFEALWDINLETFGFGTTLRQLWSKIVTTWKHVEGNFETTLVQIWDIFGTTWWLLSGYWPSFPLFCGQHIAMFSINRILHLWSLITSYFTWSF